MGALKRCGAVNALGLLTNFSILKDIIEISPTCSANKGMLVAICVSKASRKAQEDAYAAGTMLKHMRSLKSRRETWSTATRKLNATDVSLLRTLLDCASGVPWKHNPADVVAVSKDDDADMLALEDRAPPTVPGSAQEISTDFVVDDSNPIMTLSQDCERLMQSFGQQASRHGGPKGVPMYSQYCMNSEYV